MTTLFLLMAQYEGRAVIPLEMVRADYFPHLTTANFTRKLASAEIALPVIRIEASQKSARGIHLRDLAEFVDRRRDAARRELAQLTR